MPDEVNDVFESEHVYRMSPCEQQQQQQRHRRISILVTMIGFLRLLILHNRDENELIKQINEKS